MMTVLIQEWLKGVAVKVFIFTAGLMVGAFLGNVWFHLQVGSL